MPMSIISSSLLVPIMDAISIIQNQSIYPITCCPIGQSLYCPILLSPTSQGRVTHFCCSLSVFLSLVFIGPFSGLQDQLT
ncbi:hypothetical protein BDF20DRAFT_875519 [Mycotypha africana]|uniref:uncharacterized protein n=2 Tax=Mycotypha africana TaxID=64632 RepID=UPI0022FFCCE3|nr:uncharacterized protein BDF20DRAFT_903644 [Mycotypha africana]XP_052930619.1 uncharacterized protein BDF20DRAFT_903523 [Mycotypha africana]XP_052935843.1 uncharacterized protein BDF20DRAFT_875506 [Mycotypha africana]XP_052935844.1 uncharacterized protein BDF20DRAFT_875519 [Mycotypha africana]KAI8966909.1 hypothetical protein BDF20DRAFT_903644 [Mycotypha africana]KAI8966978.1 hypothetical protein BDF20DRAFT_903523 [Mycotypha africana]KAI8977559.1 hypothetical protein BDF20DRAFT_875506 [Myco